MRIDPSIVGLRFGRLLVVAKAASNRLWQSRWECVCDCGNTKIASGARLRSGHTKSCGCLSREKSSARAKARNLSHGQYGSPEYQSYHHARHRCTNPNSHAWKDYGGRGIKFKFESFEHFFAVLGLRPAGTSLDRFPDNDGHYEPGNVRWATAKQQASNRRTKRVPA